MSKIARKALVLTGLFLAGAAQASTTDNARPVQLASIDSGSVYTLTYSTHADQRQPRLLSEASLVTMASQRFESSATTGASTAMGQGTSTTLANSVSSRSTPLYLLVGGILGLCVVIGLIPLLRNRRPVRRVPVPAAVARPVPVKATRTPRTAGGTFVVTPTRMMYRPARAGH